MRTVEHRIGSESYRFFRNRKLLATSALFLVLVGCANAPVPHEANATFNQPHQGPYYLNAQDAYYDELRATMRSVKSRPVQDKIDRLLDVPVAQWLNDDAKSARQLIRENIDGSRSTDSIPLFVAYNIPNRDLGGEARGGMDDSAAYSHWINAISDEIGDSPAIIVLEPDALPGVPMMQSNAERDQRISLLHGALATLRHNKHTAVYLDAGNSKWVKPADMADLIRRVDPDGHLLGGISLNVSSYRSQAETTTYARAIMASSGRELYVLIDNSRNGAPNTNQLTGWCNVSGEKIGNVDNEYTPSQQIEVAYIKTPGESDGQCGDSKRPAGIFDPNLLIDLVS